VSLLEATAPGDGPPLHVHHNGDEISRVLKGRFRLRIGPGRQVRQPGGRAARPGASDRNPKKLNAPRDTNSSP